MNDQELANLTDTELSRQLTDTRITLESIYPYKDKATSVKRQQLWAEVKRREQLKTFNNQFEEWNGNSNGSVGVD